MALEITWELTGVIRTFFGTVTSEDIRNSINYVHDDSRFPNLDYSINDFLGVTSVDLPKSVMAQAAMKTIRDSRHNTKVLVAIVATDSTALELAQFYVSPAYQPYPAKIFDSVALAREWIEFGTD